MSTTQHTRVPLDDLPDDRLENAMAFLWLLRRLCGGFHVVRGGASFEVADDLRRAGIATMQRVQTRDGVEVFYVRLRGVK